MTVGILGAGQLARMLALAGYPLGMNFRCYDPTPDSPAAPMAPQTIGNYEDFDALAKFASAIDVLTYEFENVPVAAARFLAERAPVYPPPAALEAAQDRLTEKTLFASLGIPTPPFVPINSLLELENAVTKLGLPAVLKTRRMGYDGKGQTLLRANADIVPAWEALGSGSVPLILEGFVPFDRELSLLLVRGRDGGSVCYPLVENQHREGILRQSIAPSENVTPALQAQAELYGDLVADALDYVGVLAIEFFVQDGRLIANEMAPRVHNSGHWTIEGAETSQFENHLRAVAGLPLGSVECVGFSAMLNLIGTTPDANAILAVPGAHLHLYGKSPRPGRKLGHITLRADDMQALAHRLKTLRALIPDV